MTGTTEDSRTASTVRTGPAYAWYLAAGAVTAGVAATGAWLYPGLPQSLPMHWNGAGQADSFADKSFLAVFSVPLITLGLILFLLGTAALAPRLAQWSGQVRHDAAAHAANLRATQFFLGGSTLALSLLLAWLALRGWLLPPDGSTLEFLLPTLAFFLAMAGLGFAALRRYRRDVAGTADRQVDGTGAGAPAAGEPAAADMDPVYDRSNYRAGIYTNRADPRVLVPKRIGVGVTLNAGRPAGLAFYLAIALISAAGLVAGIALPLLAD